MRINRLGIIAAVVVGLVACGQLASAQEAKEGKGKGKRGFSAADRLERMTEELKLTDEQKPKVKAVLEDSDKKRQEIFADSSVPQDQRREKFRAIMDDESKKLKEILKPDQYEKWEKLRESMRGGRGGGEKKGEQKKEN